MNLAVVAAKLVAFASTNAMSVLAETAHTGLDAANNVFALWVARVAGEGPDDDHPYGHQKFETLGALVIVGLLSITVFELVQHTGLRMLAAEPLPVEATPLAIGIMAASALAGAGISWYEGRRGRALGSDILLADAAHTRSDVLTTLAVLAGLFAVRAGYPMADPVIAVLVAVIIGLTGWQIVRRAIPVLVDERAVPPERIRRVAEEHDAVVSAYGIRSRGRPGEVFAELTIAVAAHLDVETSHAIADDVELRIARSVHAREVVVHVEPAS